MIFFFSPRQSCIIVCCVVFPFCPPLESLELTLFVDQTDQYLREIHLPLDAIPAFYNFFNPSFSLLSLYFIDFNPFKNEISCWFMGKPFIDFLFVDFVWLHWILLLFSSSFFFPHLSFSLLILSLFCLDFWSRVSCGLGWLPVYQVSWGWQLTAFLFFCFLFFCGWTVT